MLDIENILTEFVKIARLRTYDPPLSVNAESGLKNVLRIRPDDVSKEDYPFITLDLTSIIKEVQQEWIDDLQVDVNDKVIYSTNYDLLISYHVYGEGARAIANQLQSFFRFETTRISINQNTGGGKIVQTFAVESLPQTLADKFVDSSVFTLQFVITDTEADVLSTVIDNIGITGELVHAGYESAEDDPAPLIADIVVNNI